MRFSRARFSRRWVVAAVTLTVALAIPFTLHARSHRLMYRAGFHQLELKRLREQLKRLDPYSPERGPVLRRFIYHVECRDAYIQASRRPWLPVDLPERE